MPRHSNPKLVNRQKNCPAKTGNCKTSLSTKPAIPPKASHLDGFSILSNPAAILTIPSTTLNTYLYTFVNFLQEHTRLLVKETEKNSRKGSKSTVF